MLESNESKTFLGAFDVIDLGERGQRRENKVEHKGERIRYQTTSEGSLEGVELSFALSVAPQGAAAIL